MQAKALHFIGESGSDHNPDDGLFLAKTLEDVIDSMGQAFHLNAGQRVKLMQSGYLSLDNRDFDFVATQACGCAKPWEHGKTITPEDWAKLQVNQAIVEIRNVELDRAHFIPQLATA